MKSTIVAPHGAHRPMSQLVCSLERGITAARSAGLFSALRAADTGSTLRTAQGWR